MRKIFKVLGVVLLVIVLVYAVFFAYEYYKVPPNGHIGKWTVVEMDGKKIESSNTLNYYFFKDNRATKMGVAGGKVVLLQDFILTGNMYDFKLYQMEVDYTENCLTADYYKQDGEQYMRLTSNDGSYMIMKLIKNAVPSISAYHNMKFIKSHYPHKMTAYSGAEFNIRFFANGYYQLDEDIDRYKIHASGDSITLKHGDYSYLKLLSDKELYWYLEDKRFLMTIDRMEETAGELKEMHQDYKNAAKLTEINTKAYKVGDFYIDADNDLSGVVFEVDETGLHGKIVHLYQSPKDLQWCKFEFNESIFEGADSKTDGFKNMEQIMKLPDWRNNYPAFAYCADMGKGWYLPAKEELECLVKNKEALNVTLKKFNGHIIRPNKNIGWQEHGWYWSSTESSSRKDLSWRTGWDFNTGSSTGVPEQHTYHEHTVRAVHKF